MVASHRIGAFLAVIKDGGEFSDYDRIILHHVVTVTALELVKKKAVAETEKRLAGDFFDELIASDLYEEEIARRLAFFGLEPGAEQLIMLVDIDGFKALVDGARDSEETAQDVKERLHWAVDEFLAQRDLLFISASHSDSVIVLVQLGERSAHDILALTAELQSTIDGMIPEVTVSIGIGRPHRQLVDLRQSYYEALYAIQIRKLKGGTSVIASFDDLGSYGLLLGLQDTVSLEVFYDSVLGKLHEYDEQNASDLVKSLACFLEANGHWGEAAERLYVHRHTLRYRMKRVEDITGRDLGSSQDRMEFWLALKARELIAQSGKRRRVARRPVERRARAARRRGRGARAVRARRAPPGRRASNRPSSQPPSTGRFTPVRASQAITKRTARAISAGVDERGRSADFAAALSVASRRGSSGRSIGSGSHAADAHAVVGPRLGQRGHQHDLRRLGGAVAGEGGRRHRAQHVGEGHDHAAVGRPAPAARRVRQRRLSLGGSGRGRRRARHARKTAHERVARGAGGHKEAAHDTSNDACQSRGSMCWGRAGPNGPLAV